MNQEQLIPVGIAIAAGASVYGLDWIWKWLFRSKRRQMKAGYAAVKTLMKIAQSEGMDEDKFLRSAITTWHDKFLSELEGWEQPKEK